MLLLLAIVVIIAMAVIIKVQVNKVDVYERWIWEFRNDLIEAVNNMRSIDDKNMFEKDDDVGSVFQQMLKIIENVNQRTSIERDYEEKKEDGVKTSAEDR